MTTTEEDDEELRAAIALSLRLYDDEARGSPASALPCGITTAAAEQGATPAASGSLSVSADVSVAPQILKIKWGKTLLQISAVPHSCEQHITPDGRSRVVCALCGAVPWSTPAHSSRPRTAVHKSCKSASPLALHATGNSEWQASRISSGASRPRAACRWHGRNFWASVRCRLVT